MRTGHHRLSALSCDQELCRLMLRLVYFLTSIFTFAPIFTLAQTASSKENWSRIAVTRSDFAPPSPTEAGIQTHPGFTRELLQVQWRQGDPIDVYIVRPENAVRPPAVLFLYTWPGDAEHFKSDDWCRNVTQHGFTAVGFVSALTGQRYHDRPWKETFVTELPETLAESVHDVQLMLDFLDTRKDLDKSRYGIFGQGSGGTIALLAASVDRRLKAVDVIDPWGDWPVFFQSSPVLLDSERQTLLTQKSLDALAPLEPTVAMNHLSGRALRLQQTTMNLSTPEHAAKLLQTSLPSSAVYVQYRSEQEYREKAMKDAGVLTWLQQELATSPASLGNKR